MKIEVYDSINRINKNDWDSIFKDTPEGYGFYQSIEESHLKEFKLYYLFLYGQEGLRLIAPLFISDFNLDIAVEGFLKKVIVFIRKIFPRFMIIKSLFCGSPFGESGLIGFNQANKDSSAEVKELAVALKKLSKEKGAKLIIFKDFPLNLAKRLQVLLKEGFFKVNSFPSAINEVKFSSLEDYIKSLGKATRKSLRRKLRSAYAKGRIEIKEVTSTEGILKEVFSLYLNTYRQGNTKFERLTEEFFISVSKNMQPYFKIFLYYVDGRLGAFNLCFVYKDLLIDKFIGFDYNISNPCHLYFVSWCYNIEWCIKNSVRFYQTGQTDYYAKLKLGCKLVPLYAYLRHNNPVMNIILKLLALFLKPENFDSDIRKS
ncbi:MAG: GNAT family N-acetyltransferase [Candidatus Omnitrophota bacterium]